MFLHLLSTLKAFKERNTKPPSADAEKEPTLFRLLLCVGVTFVLVPQAPERLKMATIVREPSLAKRFWAQQAPKAEDWIALTAIVAIVAFLSIAIMAGSRVTQPSAPVQEDSPDQLVLNLMTESVPQLSNPGTSRVTFWMYPNQVGIFRAPNGVIIDETRSGLHFDSEGNPTIVITRTTKLDYMYHVVYVEPGSVRTSHAWMYRLVANVDKIEDQNSLRQLAKEHLDCQSSCEYLLIYIVDGYIKLETLVKS